MPQVDLETLVSACAGVSCDRKVACETIAAATTTTTATTADDLEIPPDFPPDSFCLSKDDEVDWFDRNAFFERKDSTKGTSISTNLNPSINPNTTSNSQRFTNLKAKSSIIGLPKNQKSCLVEAAAAHRRVCRQPHTHFFPKKSASVSKSGSVVFEPSSPKVSCIGRVRSKRDRSRRSRNRQRSTRSNESNDKSERKNEKSDRRQKTGFLASFKAIFRASSKNVKKVENDLSSSGKSKSLWRKSGGVKSHDIRDRLPANDRYAPPRKSTGSEPAGEAVGLGGMKRFASGRRSEAWDIGVDVA